MSPLKPLKGVGTKKSFNSDFKLDEQIWNCTRESELGWEE